MKKIIASLFIALAGMFAGHAQSALTQMREIIDVEDGNGEVVLSVFSMPTQDGENCYYLYAGEMGFGDEVLQINLDPISKLFIPLGKDYEETMETLQMLKERFKATPGTSIEMEGCFAPLVPNDKRETIKITTKKVLFSRKLMFSIEMEDHLRATYVSKSDFNNLMFNLKLNKALFK